MASNVWINDLMRCFKRFLGVYSIDTVKRPLVYPSYTIVNFSNSREVGTHFVAILFYTPAVCLYFDPLNLSFIPAGIFDYMTENSISVYRVNFKIQNDSSIFCAFYCLIPIFLHMNDIPISEGLSLFQKNKLSNDKKCITLLKVLIKKYFQTISTM